jgi:hypothetical protein
MYGYKECIQVLDVNAAYICTALLLHFANYLDHMTDTLLPKNIPMVAYALTVSARTIITLCLAHVTASNAATRTATLIQ